jgi:hypothetical protein
MSDQAGLADEVRQLLRHSSTGSNSESGTNSTLSPVGLPVLRCPRPEFAKSMAHLCALKRTATLTPVQMEAWHGVLGIFGAKVINSAVIEMVLSESRFPELGDLYQICRREALKRGELKLPYSPHGGDSDVKRPTKAEIAAVASRLGLEV